MTRRREFSPTTEKTPGPMAEPSRPTNGGCYDPRRLMPAPAPGPVTRAGATGFVRERLACGWRVSCDHCGTVFDIPYRINVTRAHRPKYCSRQCGAKAAKARAAERLDERFWSNVDIRGRDECWEWTGRRAPTGYGLFDHGNRPHIASRFAFMLTHDRFNLTVHQDVCHACDNPPCCNPAHLWLGDAKANSQDMVRKGRHRPSGLRGERVSTAKLTADDVRDIRTSPERPPRLAQRYGVTKEQIYNIVKRRHWRHVP